MKSNIFLKVIFYFALLFSLSASAAPLDNAEAKVWAKDKGTTLLNTFAEKDIAKKFAALDDLFLNHVDLDYISRFVIGKYWKAMDKQQQEKYTDLFKRYALGSYKSFPLDFGDRVSFEILSATKSGDYTDVVAQVRIKSLDRQSEDSKILITFKLDKKADGIKIVDIKVAESSLILSYRQRFYQMVTASDEDMTWFLEDFETSVKSTEETNRMKLEDSY